MGDTNRPMRLISGRVNPALSQQVAEILGCTLTDATISTFADGETYAKVNESIRGCDVFIIQPTAVRVNDALMELLILLDALKRASAHRVTAVIPYYGYARQDRKAMAREPITAKLVADLLETAGVDRVLTIDLHTDQIQGFFNVPVDNLDALPLIASKIVQHNLKDLCVVSPDAGGAQRARKLAKILHCPLAIIDKRRVKHNDSEVMHLVGDVAGKNCILVDDMVDTGGTITKAAHAVKAQGALKVFCAAVHPILSGNAVTRLNDSDFEEVILANTVPIPPEKMKKKFTVVSVAPLLAEAIARIHNHESVSELFDKFVELECKNN